MPKPAHALAGLFVLLACGCSAMASTSVPSPTPTKPPTPTPAANWNQDMTLAGDVNTRIQTIAPTEPKVHSECSGKNSRTTGTWASTIYWILNGDRWGVVVLAPNYKGPGVYAGGAVSVQVHNGDSSKVWKNLDTDPANFVVGGDEESGTIDATLSNLSAYRGRLHISGRWSCKT
jgi:hypothetical protein